MALARFSATKLLLRPDLQSLHPPIDRLLGVGAESRLEHVSNPIIILRDFDEHREKRVTVEDCQDLRLLLSLFNLDQGGGKLCRPAAILTTFDFVVFSDGMVHQIGLQRSKCGALVLGLRNLSDDGRNGLESASNGVLDLAVTGPYDRRAEGQENGGDAQVLKLDEVAETCRERSVESSSQQ